MKMPQPRPDSETRDEFCEICGKSLNFLPPSKRIRNRTCSLACKSVCAKNDIAQGKRKAPPKRKVGDAGQKKLKRQKCADCGKGLYLNNTSGFCRTCFNKRKYKGGNFCKICGVPINYGCTYCTKHQNTDREVEKIKYTCPYCGKLFERYKSSVKVKNPYCSRSCAQIVTGRNNGSGKTDTRKLLRNSAKWIQLNQVALNRDKYECQKCGARKNLVVHHIVPVGELIDKFIKETGSNLKGTPSQEKWQKIDNFDSFWDVDNLMTLCHYCHSKVHPNINLIKNMYFSKNKENNYARAEA